LVARCPVTIITAREEQLDYVEDRWDLSRNCFDLAPAGL